MNDVVQWAALAPLLALVGSLINAFFGRSLKEPVPGIIASLAVAGGFVLAVLAFFGLQGSEHGVQVTLWRYLTAGTLHLDAGFMIDRLSVTMMLIITGVGLLIHIYSIGYMHGDDGNSRYFAELNLFVAAMLVLVMADSFPLMFIGWEGVGVCSYLLIGFWYRDRANPDAGRKAFIVNRVGDVGFLLAMFLTFKVFGTLNIGAVNAAAPAMLYGSATLTLIGLLYLLGAAGKSAQLPLQVWLPDAMAGPTPVSALIHAATMVTAGVYLIARIGAVYAMAPAAASTVAWVGALTAFVAAFAAFAQTDIKKILAYSTISQVGYMIAAVGAGAYWVGIFHVLTHAFFKALLFLTAGSVIHAMNGEQDIRKMGGLGRKMKITGVTALIGTLAISGVPFLAGFFSKDAILSGTLTSGLLAGNGGDVRLHPAADHGRHDGGLHVPLVLRHLRRCLARGQARRRARPRVAAGDDLAARHPGRGQHRRRLPGAARVRLPEPHPALARARHRQGRLQQRIRQHRLAARRPVDPDGGARPGRRLVGLPRAQGRSGGLHEGFQPGRRLARRAGLRRALPHPLRGLRRRRRRRHRHAGP